jgi:hypothetical protein
MNPENPHQSADVLSAEKLGATIAEEVGPIIKAHLNGVDPLLAFGAHARIIEMIVESGVEHAMRYVSPSGLTRTRSQALYVLSQAISEAIDRAMLRALIDGK